MATNDTSSYSRFEEHTTADGVDQKDQPRSNPYYYDLTVPWDDDFYAHEPDVVAVFHVDNESTRNSLGRTQVYFVIIMLAVVSYFGAQLLRGEFSDNNEFFLAALMVGFVVTIIVAFTGYVVRRIEQLKTGVSNFGKIPRVVAITREGIRKDNFNLDDLMSTMENGAKIPVTITTISSNAVIPFDDIEAIRVKQRSYLDQMFSPCFCCGYASSGAEMLEVTNGKDGTRKLIGSVVGAKALVELVLENKRRRVLELLAQH
mmetsp:Transcript_8273/g.13692  ORF Transcript_8273/g.13692 Transcript_8273/m.13692 type:complete len:259 (+) Transcript_8273:35-811(+)